MRKYETIFIINPDLSEEDSKGVIEKVRDIIQSLQGEVLKIEPWGNKRMAYEIKRMSKGFFVLLHFMGTAQVLGELERNLRLMDAVLKYQTVRLDEKKEKIAQTVSGEKISEKEEKPESQTDSSREKSPEEQDMPEEVAHEPPRETTSGTQQPDRNTGEETHS
jgi:small subunit ribosomal protein S6